MQNCGIVKFAKRLAYVGENFGFVDFLNYSINKLQNCSIINETRNIYKTGLFTDYRIQKNNQSVVTAVMQIYANLLTVHARSIKKIWIFQGLMAWNKTDFEMSSVAFRRE